MGSWGRSFRGVVGSWGRGRGRGSGCGGCRGGAGAGAGVAGTRTITY